MTLIRALAFAVLLAASVPASPAFAHEPKPRHGGAVATAGTYHVELVVKDGQVDVYLVDHDDKPIAATGRKGVAILMAGGKSVRVPLTAAGRERLSGKAAEPLQPGAKGVVQITEPSGGTVQARFN
jgi:hypothetical protein